MRIGKYRGKEEHLYILNVKRKYCSEVLNILSINNKVWDVFAIGNRT